MDTAPGARYRRVALDRLFRITVLLLAWNSLSAQSVLFVRGADDRNDRFLEAGSHPGRTEQPADIFNEAQHLASIRTARAPLSVASTIRPMRSTCLPGFPTPATRILFLQTVSSQLREIPTEAHETRPMPHGLPLKRFDCVCRARRSIRTLLHTVRRGLPADACQTSRMWQALRRCYDQSLIRRPARHAFLIPGRHHSIAEQGDLRTGTAIACSEKRNFAAAR